MKTLKTLILVAILLTTVFACTKEKIVTPTLLKTNTSPVPPTTAVTDTTLRTLVFNIILNTSTASQFQNLNIMINHKGDSVYNLLLGGVMNLNYLSGSALTAFLKNNLSSTTSTQIIYKYSVTLHKGDDIMAIAYPITQLGVFCVGEYKYNTTIAIDNHGFSDSCSGNSAVSGTLL